MVIPSFAAEHQQGLGNPLLVGWEAKTKLYFWGCPLPGLLKMAFLEGNQKEASFLKGVLMF